MFIVLSSRFWWSSSSPTERFCHTHVIHKALKTDRPRRKVCWEGLDGNPRNQRVLQSKFWALNKIRQLENMEIMYNKWNNRKNPPCPYPLPPLTPIIAHLMISQYFVVLQYFFLVLLLKRIQVYHPSWVCTDLAENQHSVSLNFPTQTSPETPEFVPLVELIVKEFNKKQKFKN